MAPQHDAVISNASGAAVRADLNNALAALITNSSGASSPSTTYAFQFWADSTAGQLKIRNAANSAWIVLMELDGTMLMEDGTLAAPGLAFASDLDTGFSRSAANKINFSTGGAERLEIGSTEVVFNDPSNDVDFRVESNGNTHMLFVDGGNDVVLVGMSSAIGTNGLQVGGGGNSGNGAFHRFDANDSGPFLQLLKSRNGTVGGNTVVQSGDELGTINFQGADGTDYHSGARIAAFADGTPGNNDMPGRLVFSTTADGASSPTERLRINSAGLVGIGTAAPLHGLLTLSQSASSAFNALVIQQGNTGSAATDGLHIGIDSGVNAYITHKESRALAFGTANTERMRLDSSGKLLVGASSARANFNDGTDESHIQLEGTTQNTSTISTVRNANNDGPAHFVLGKSRGTAANSTAIVQSGDAIGNINFEAADGTHLIRAAQISASVDGTPGANDMPGRLVFATTADGAASPTERMRLDSSGRLLLGTSSVFTESNAKLVVQSGGTAIAEFYNAGGSYNIWSSGSTPTAKGFVGTADQLVTGGSADDFAVRARNRLIFSTNGSTERMRITSDGTMQMGDASTAANGRWAVFISDPTSSVARGRMIFHAKTGTGGEQEILQIFIGTTEKLRIRADGNITNANNSYGSLSDVKLKENIIDAASQWDDIKGLRVRKYNFKEDTGHDTHTQIGLVAQEVETVSPGLVTDLADNDTDGKQTDTVTKSVNYSVLYMKAVKALQEAMTRIEQLETKVAALEAG
jgi:hypothetical protein